MSRELYNATPGFWDGALYSCDDGDETLIHTDPDDAIEEALDKWLSPKVSVLEHLRSAVGETITVFAFKRRVVDDDEPDAERLLEDVLERLDEEYGNPDEASTPTDAMRTAAETFCAAIRAEYHVWQCDGFAQAKVNVDAWVRDRRPDWLEVQP